MTTLFAGFLLSEICFEVFWLSIMGCRFIHGHHSLRTLLLGSGFRLSFPIILVFVLLGVGASIFCFAWCKALYSFGSPALSF